MSTGDISQSQKLPFEMKLKDGSTLIARQVSSIFSRMTIADLGIDIQLGLDKRIYVTLNPSLQGKVTTLIELLSNI